MSVNFGAAIFEETANILKILDHGSAITAECCMRGCSKARTDSCGVLVQNKDRKDVAENHSHKDQAHAAQE